MVGQYQVKTKYLIEQDEFNDRLIDEVIKYNGLQVDWGFCKRLETLGIVDVLNYCTIFHRPVYHWVFSQGIEKEV